MPVPEFWQAIEEFNRQEFYACHDTLEALWMEAAESEKRFYQGILQIAVGCYHLGNANWQGAVVSLGEGSRRISAYQPSYENINVDQLLAESLELLEALQQIKPEEIGKFLAELETSSPPQQEVSESSPPHRLPKIVKVDI